MQKFLLTLVLALMAIANTWAAYVDGIYYNLEVSAKTAQVTSGSNKYTGSVAIPSSITYNGITYSVTSIGSYTFSSCSGLTSVTIPNSVTSIGSYTFSSCSGLTSVTIPNSVTSIEDGAFFLCSGLTSVTIPNSVTSIAKEAFTFCSGLTSVTIPNSVTSIEGWAFSGCSGLTSITIPNSVTSIGKSAFSGCSRLTSIEIPNSVTSIGGGVFSGCSRLTSIIVDEANANYSSLNGVLFNKEKTELIQYPEGKTGAYTIPNTVTSIEGWAFYECSGLTSVTIPNSVTNIGKGAFYGCDGLRELHFKHEHPEEMKIGEYAFEYLEDCTLYVPIGTGYAYRHHPEFKWMYKEVVIEK